MASVFLTSYECFTRQAQFGQRGEGPVFVDARTYRFKGHSMSDPQKYRTKEEFSQYEQRDPINALTKHRVENEITDQTQFDELDRRAKQMALEAIQFADACPNPSLEKMYTMCTAEPFGPYKTASSQLGPS